MDKVYNAENFFWMALLYRKKSRSNQWKCLFSKNRGINEEIKKILPKKCTKTVLGLFRRKDKISSNAKSNLVADNVFDLQNEFYDNRTYFLVKILFGNFWPFLRSSLFRPQNIRQEVSVWSGNLPGTLFLYGESEKNGLGTICWPPRFQLRRFLLKSTLKTFYHINLYF